MVLMRPKRSLTRTSRSREAQSAVAIHRPRLGRNVAERPARLGRDLVDHLSPLDLAMFGDAQEAVDRVDTKHVGDEA
jgi:hypothetical protein